MLGIEGKKKKKKKMMMKEEDMSQYDDSHYWTKPKRDKKFFGHMKIQSLF